MKRLIKDTSFAAFFLLVIALVAAEAATTLTEKAGPAQAVSRAN